MVAQTTRASIVIGASGDIGAAVAERLAHDGLADTHHSTFDRLTTATVLCVGNVS